MRARYVLAPEAALDLVQIWRYIKKNTSLEMADRVESGRRSGTLRQDAAVATGARILTDEPVDLVFDFFLVKGWSSADSTRSSRVTRRSSDLGRFLLVPTTSFSSTG